MLKGQIAVQPRMKPLYMLDIQIGFKCVPRAGRRDITGTAAVRQPHLDPLRTPEQIGQLLECQRHITVLTDRRPQLDELEEIHGLVWQELRVRQRNNLCPRCYRLLRYGWRRPLRKRSRRILFERGIRHELFFD